jgi:hypothetical protein
VLHNYTATETNQLSLIQGEVVHVIKQGTYGWTFGEVRQRKDGKRCVRATFMSIFQNPFSVAKAGFRPRM